MRYDGHPSGVPSVILSGFRQNILCCVRDLGFSGVVLYPGGFSWRRRTDPTVRARPMARMPTGTALAAQDATSAKCESRSSAWATAPRRSSRASYYRNAPDDQFVPGLMHVNLGGYHIRDIEFTAAFDIDVETRSARTSARRSSREPNNTSSSPTCRNLGVPVQRGMTHDGLGKYLSAGDHQGPRPDRRHRRRSCKRHRDRCGHHLPAGRLRDGDQVVCRAGPRSRLRLRQLHPGLHRPRGVLARSASRSAACRSSATTSRARSARPSPTAC